MISSTVKVSQMLSRARRPLFAASFGSSDKPITERVLETVRGTIDAVKGMVTDAPEKVGDRAAGVAAAVRDAGRGAQAMAAEGMQSARSALSTEDPQAQAEPRVPGGDSAADGSALQRDAPPTTEKESLEAQNLAEEIVRKYGQGGATPFEVFKETRRFSTARRFFATKSASEAGENASAEGEGDAQQGTSKNDKPRSSDADAAWSKLDHQTDDHDHGEMAHDHGGNAAGGAGSPPGSRGPQGKGAAAAKDHGQEELDLPKMIDEEAERRAQAIRAAVEDSNKEHAESQTSSGSSSGRGYS